MHVNELSGPYAETVAAKQCFQVALVLLGGEGDWLDAGRTFAELLSSTRAGHPEGAEWCAFSLKASACVPIKSLDGWCRSC